MTDFKNYIAVDKAEAERLQRVEAAARQFLQWWDNPSPGVDADLRPQIQALRDALASDSETRKTDAES